MLCSCAPYTDIVFLHTLLMGGYRGIELKKCSRDAGARCTEALNLADAHSAQPVMLNCVEKDVSSVKICHRRV